VATEVKTRIKSALAKRTGNYEHLVSVGDHRLITDEPSDLGGGNAGPSPQELLAASLASCTATTIEMYAAHKGWEIGEIKVKVEYEPAKRGAPTTFNVKLCVPPGLDDEQIRRVTEIAAKCPVHRTLDGEVIFNESITIQ
jgi:putative redox protein